jgi:glutamate decarboxylase
MNNPSLDDLLQRHFSIAALEAAPVPLQQALRLLRDWLAGGRKHAYPVTPLSELAQGFDQYSLPAEGIGALAFLDEFERTVMANTAQLNHPKFIGHMTQALPWITVIAEAFTAALNQNQVKIETAYVSTLIEKQVIGWLHRKVYGYADAFYAGAMQASNEAIGNIVNGGTMGNLTALAVALEHQLPGTRANGLFAAMQEAGYRGLAVLGSARAHYSIKKALATLGLGEKALHSIPVDQHNRIDLAALDIKIAELKRAGIKIVALLGIAGTTETGAIDPLAALAEVAQREKIWFHVDAAWGGALLLSERLAPLYRGIELADSVVIDGHKLLWVPMPQSMVLFRNQSSLSCLKHHANYILRDNAGDLGQTSLEGSRRFDALKLWTSFKVLGQSGYDTLLAQAATLTRQMRDLIEEQPDFELITQSDTFILTYRYAPQALRQRLAAQLEAGNHNEAGLLQSQLNALNSALQTRQKEQGYSFVSRTVLESTAYPGETTVLRVVLSNVTTRPEHLREIIAEQRQLGGALAAELGLA